MSYQDALGNFISSYWQVIVWLFGAVLFAAIVRGFVNLFLGLKRLYQKHKPL